MFVRGDVDISGNIAMSGNINCNEINSTSIRATTFYGDGSQLTGINTSGGSANLNEHSDVSFGNVDVSGNINITGKVTITINDVDAQNITLLEMKTHTNTPLIKHDFWQNSTGYGDYQIYPVSTSTTDFKIGGYSSTFQTIRLNALNGVEVYSNQSTNTFGNIKCNTLELTNKIKGPSDLVIDPSPYDSSGGNVTVMGNLKVDGLLDMSNNKTYNDLSNNNNAVLNLGQIREYNAINTYALFIKQTQHQTGIQHNITNTQLDHLIANSFSGYTDYTSDFTSNKWYPSIPGLYIHYSHVTVVSPNSGDTLRRAYTNLRKSGTNIYRSLAMVGNDGDDFEKITLTMQQIINVTQADITNNVYYDITMYVYMSSGSAVTQSTGGMDTYITIHKIA